MMQLDVAEAAVEVKLARQDSKPWGFRVTGGLDFGTPLTVLRVTAGSLAEMAGLKVGDILLTANGQPLSDFNHHESHKFLQEAGNSVDLLVVRGSLVLPPPLATPEEIAQAEAEAEAQAKAEAEAKVKAEEEARKAAIDPLTVLKPFPPPATPSVFETIFGPLEEFQIEQSKDEFEELVNELVHEEGEKDIEIPSDILVEESASAENEVPELSVTEQSTAPAAADMDSVKDTPVNAVAVVSDTVSAMATAENIGPEPVSPLSQLQQEKETVPITEEVRRDFTEEELEEELEEFMLGHAELLRGKALGVDFDKLVVSNNEVVEHSQVLKTLKEEQNQPEKKKFSTFLIRPNRPKIKPKEKPKPQENKKLLEIKSVNSANEKPKQTETKLECTVSTKDEQKPQEINQEITTEKLETKYVINTDQESTEAKEVVLTSQESVENKEVEESDSQEKEQIGIQIGTAEEVMEVTTSEKEGTEDKDEHLPAESIEERAQQQVYKVNETEKEPQDRLTVLQKQLAALLLLPAAMQQQLSLLQQEMSNIVVQQLAQLNKLAEHKEKMEAPIAVLQVNVQGQDELHKNEEDKNKKSKHEDEENKVIEEETEVRTDSERTEKVEHTEQGVADGSAMDHQELLTEIQEHSAKESLSQESEATEIIAEKPSDEHMDENKKQPEEPKIKFHPKTPRPRPVMLPRRLRLQMFPESAYNEEFIAENLSGNAEIIMGNTIGVNFQKYTRNYDHLKSSSVLRMINESEGRRPSALPPPPKQLITPKIIKQKEEPIVTVESRPKEEPNQDPNMNAESVPKESNPGAEPVDLDKPKPEEEPIASKESEQIPNAESVVSEEVAVEEAKGEPTVTEDSIQKEPSLPVEDSTVKEEINAAINSEEKEGPAVLEAPKSVEELAAQESNPVADPIALATAEPTPVLVEEPAAQESNPVADPIAVAIEEPTPVLKDEPTDNGESKP